MAELGTWCLVAALMVALMQAAYLLPALRNALSKTLPVAAWLQALLVAGAFFALMNLRVDSDFSVANVAEHSNLSLPLLYKISGTWGNHEGSMLLWTLVLSGFGLALACGRKRDEALSALAIAVQSLLAAGVLLFVLFTSNPFARLFPPPMDGKALNPLLQDIALAIHPPLLYLGYVGFSIVFSLAVAALIRGEAGRVWAVFIHPWILAAWSALTLGVGLGSWWAYRELGWGGWWFWDPVENASLLPWLAGTALLHSNIVLKKRGMLQSWVILLAILTFGLSLLGTFLVRSGALTSVHSFASDPARGLFIMGYIVVAVGGALLLYALRVQKLETRGGMLPVSREGMIVLNNLFLLTACATVLLGTVYPLLAETFGSEKITVGAPYFNATFLPLMAAPLLLMGFAVLMPWQRGRWRQVFIKARPAFMALAAAGLLALAFSHNHAVTAAAGFGLAAWIVVSSVLFYRHSSVKGLPVLLAHLGVAFLVVGITGAGLWKTEEERLMAEGDKMQVGAYDLTLNRQEKTRGPNYDILAGEFTLTQDGREIDFLFPEYRLYDIRKTGTSEAAIRASGLDDTYVVIGQSPPGEERLAVRAYHVPLIGAVWLGCLLMAAGGIAACLRKRYDEQTSV